MANREPTDHQVLDRIETAVLRAARYLVTECERGDVPEVFVKEDSSLVMTFDLECQKLILEELRGFLPIVAEEDPDSHCLVATAKRYITVDPVDGTTSCKRFMTVQGGQIGFGPLVGYVADGIVRGVAFYNVTQRMLFSATLNGGAYGVAYDPRVEVPLPKLLERQRLIAPPVPKLTSAAVLFYVGVDGETSVVQKLKHLNAIENIYRFGGFANDCSRLARGFEQVAVQFAAKAWDFPAVLLAYEAGCDIVVDPLGKRIDFLSWKVADNNPVIMVKREIRDQLFAALDS